MTRTGCYSVGAALAERPCCKMAGEHWGGFRGRVSVGYCVSLPLTDKSFSPRGERRAESVFMFRSPLLSESHIVHKRL